MFNYSRRKSTEVQVGNTPLGGANPIRIQSMANVSTMDTDAAVAQALRMVEAGAEYVRFTAQGEREAYNLGEIRRRLDAAGVHTPLVADIHFNPRAADVAARMVEKVRINPGNYVDRVKTFALSEYTDEEYQVELDKIRARFLPFLEICRAEGTTIRIGVNHGSLSDRIMSRYGDTPEGMVASCMEFLRLCKEVDFPDVVISIKASNTVVMVRTVRLLVARMAEEGMAYPLHLGVTEAGDGEDGRIKSAVGIGALLADGIGDTIRVSLSEAPEAEIPVARQLVDYILQRENHEPIQASVAPGYDPLNPSRRVSRKVGNIGGGQLPVTAGRWNTLAGEGRGLIPDYRFVETGGAVSLCAGEQAYPCFQAGEVEAVRESRAAMKFVFLSWEDLKPGGHGGELLDLLRSDERLVVLLTTKHRNGVGEQRAALHFLMSEGIDVPVILCREYPDDKAEALQLKASVDLGTLLLDGFADGIMLLAPGIADPVVSGCMFGILQATRLRVSKTEYISCPSCGRTLYDLQATIGRIKAATSHLVGLKIGIMGCIVNGPGEMADADYGYVGAGRGRISLYKGKVCVMKNIPEEEAVDRLVALIKENGDWNPRP